MTSELAVNERWLLPVLACIRQRPGMYLGDERVETLAAYLSAYELGRVDVGGSGLDAKDARLLQEFEGWICAQTPEFGAQGTAGWSLLVRRVDSSAQNVRTFFTLFEQFLATRGESLNNVTPWTPLASRL